ncbi:MAG: o-succinylbenzoate synthase [Chloroflexota bacterium]
MKSITIKNIALHTIALPFVEPLKTSFGNDPVKATVLVEAQTAEGVTGWGEITVEVAPGYAAETPVTSTHIAKNFLIPRLIGQTFSQPHEAQKLMKSVRGHHHTKFGLETAIWDALAKANDLRLADLFATYLPEGNASRGYAVVGVSIGIQKSIEDTIKVIQKRYDQGYRRIKLKIQPGWDVEFARGIRAALPDIVMMLDANSAYTLADADHLMQLDAFNLLMIEQPLADDDIYEHSKLQPLLKTPICLDESIKSVTDLRLALELGALRILNLKPVRVGGYVESLEIYQICGEHNLPLWIGGMMETGVGRAANVAFASLPGVNLPSDISATDRYYNPDVTEPPFVLGANSTLAVPDAPGIGVEVQPDRLEQGKQLWREVCTYVD